MVYDGGPDAVKREGTTYKLRASNPMPTDRSGEFVRHTFMAEQTNVVTYLYTDTLPKSEEFRGQTADNPQPTDLVSAQFNRLQNFGGNSFSGNTTEYHVYVNEEFLFPGGI